MKRAYLICLFQLLTAAFPWSQSNSVLPITQDVPLVPPVRASQADPKAQSVILDSYGKLPPSFLASRVQTDVQGKQAGKLPQSEHLPFAPVVTYGSGGYYASSAAVADVNGDGKPDLLVANQCASSCSGSNPEDGAVSVLLGNGDGTFQTAVTYDSGGYFGYSVAVADVNGDGKPDLLATIQCSSIPCSSDSRIGVLLGNGDGTFQTAVTYDSGGYVAESVVVRDVNGDGKPDLVVAIQCVGYGNCANGGGVGVLLGNGDGTFQTAVTYDSGGMAESVAVADVNGDGKPDLVVANYCASGCQDGMNSTVGVLLGNGDGTFQPIVIVYSGGYASPSVAVADVNGDGKPDIVVSVQCTSDCTIDPEGMVSVLLGNGDGTFQTAVPYDSGGIYAYSVAVADVNGDGKLDLVVANGCANSNCSSNGTVGVLLGNGDGTFQTAVPYDSGGWEPLSVVVADLNGDGEPDIVLANDWVSADNLSGTVGVIINTNASVTTTTLSSSLSPSSFGQAVTLTATETSQGSGTPAGTVTFSNGSTTLGTSPLHEGKATFATLALTVGLHSVKAVYSGDNNFTGSTSNTWSQVVTKAMTTTSLLSSINPSASGKPVTFTAQVSSLAGTPRGKVEFLNGTTIVATPTLISGSAEYTTSKLPPGTNSINTVYEGDYNNSGSTSKDVNQVVRKATTTTTLTSSPNPSNYGQTVTFRATVLPQFSGTSTGNVVFKDGAKTLKTAALSGGESSYTTSTLVSGTHNITATYNGSTSFDRSCSVPLTQTVN
jgi:hypothetical protein